MTKQFTQEYINYILSDKAKTLQDTVGWAKKGDWVVINGKPELVTEVDDYVATYKARDIWCGQEEWPKLPTLWDLLQIIVVEAMRQEGPDDMLAELAEMVSAMEWTASEALMTTESIMLTAAKIATKVLQC